MTGKWETNIGWMLEDGAIWSYLPTVSLQENRQSAITFLDTLVSPFPISNATSKRPLVAQAEAHEFSLNLCQELITQHQRLTYDINMITELLTHQAKLWATIGEARRPQQEYFRVAYFGEIFSLDKNKDYVVRAQVGQKYTDL